MKMKNAITMALGWFVACLVLFYAVLDVDFNWNFLTWNPELKAVVVRDILGIVACIVAAWFLARASHQKSSTVVSFILCLALVVIAAIWFLPESLSTSGFFKHTSPLWYRSVRVLVMALPGIFWFVWFRRHHRRNAA